MTGRFYRVYRYQRSEVAADSRRLYAFGDNLARRGRAGQATIRGLPNAVGICTKHYPSMDREAFFTDDDAAYVRPHLEAAFARLRQHLLAGGDVVWPADGIGTGLAQLPRRAPQIYRYITQEADRLAQISRSD